MVNYIGANVCLVIEEEQSLSFGEGILSGGVKHMAIEVLNNYSLQLSGMPFASQLLSGLQNIILTL